MWNQHLYSWTIQHHHASSTRMPLSHLGWHWFSGFRWFDMHIMIWMFRFGRRRCSKVPIFVRLNSKLVAIASHVGDQTPELFSDTLLKSFLQCFIDYACLAWGSLGVNKLITITTYYSDLVSSVDAADQLLVVVTLALLQTFWVYCNCFLSISIWLPQMLMVENCGDGDHTVW